MAGNKCQFGYNADGTINDRESEVVRYIFEKYNEYSDNPPQELIDDVLASAECEGITLTEEEIVKRARAKVIYYLTDETNSKFPDVKYHEPVSMVRAYDKSHLIKEPTSDIIDRELWAKVQEMIRRS